MSRYATIKLSINFGHDPDAGRVVLWGKRRGDIQYRSREDTRAQGVWPFVIAFRTLAAELSRVGREATVFLSVPGDQR